MKILCFVSSLILFFILLLQTNPVSSYLLTNNELKDLYKSETCFTSDANSWTASKLVGTSKTTTCGSDLLVGGYNILGDAANQKNEYFSRTYTGLPTHTYIYYTITLFAVDTWDDSRADNDSFQLVFDTTTVTGFTGLVLQRFYESICGLGSYYDLRNLRVFGRIAHTANSLTLKIVSLMGEPSSNESFGFRDVNLLFISPGTAPGNAMCGTALGSATFTGACTCKEGQYNNAGTCTDCDASCASCFGSGATQCYQCKTGYSLVGTSCTQCYGTCSVCHGSNYNQCDDCNEGYFLFNGTQCVSPCDPPLIQSTTACTSTCLSPCSNATDYIYWDGSCSATCQAPLVQGTTLGILKTCSYPCTADQYLLPNGSCSANCTSPHILSVVLARKICVYPCSSGQHLYWNSTCQNSCTFPLRSNNTEGRLYCEYACNSTAYLYWNGTCSSTCPSPFSIRNENGYKFCDFPTQDTTLYLYWNGTLSASCNAPLTPRTEGSPLARKFCDFKCTGTNYLYWNGSCNSTCNYPLEARTYGSKNFCFNPCATDFLYWNGSCLSSCPTPYLNRTDAGGKYCDFSCPANNYAYWDGSCSPSCLGPLTPVAKSTGYYCNYGCQTTEFLYWNGSCKSSCGFPLSSTNNKSRNFCNYPCNATEYLYYNGTCSSNCEEPFVAVRESGKGYCNYPCQSTEFFFWNGSCIPACNPPLTMQAGFFGEQYCLTPCVNPLDYYEVETGICTKTCNESSRVENGLFLRCLPAPGSVDQGLMEEFLGRKEEVGKISLLSYPKFADNIRWLKIRQPPRLLNFNLRKARPILLLKFGFSPPSGLTTGTLRQLSLDIYQAAGFDSNFLVNYWDDLISLALVLGIAIVLLLIDLILSKTSWTATYLFFNKLKTLFKWNFFIMMLAADIGDIILYTSIEFRNLSLDDFPGTLGLLVNLAMLVLVLVFFIVSIFRIKKFRAAYRNSETEKFFKSYEGSQILYKGFKETHWASQYFYVLYTTRLALPMFITACLIDIPIAQTVLQTLVNVVALIYIFWAAPIKRKVNLVQLLVVEGLYLILNCCALSLSILDKTDSQNYGAQIWLGDAIIITSFIMNIVQLVFLGYKVLVEFLTIMKIQNKQPKMDLSRWVRLPVVVLQQAAFGFEEMLDECLVDPNPQKRDLESYERVATNSNISEIKKEPAKPDKGPYVPLDFNGEATSITDGETSPSFKRIDQLRSRYKTRVQDKPKAIIEEAKEEETARGFGAYVNNPPPLLQIPHKLSDVEDVATDMPSVLSASVTQDLGRTALINSGYRRQQTRLVMNRDPINNDVHEEELSPSLKKTFIAEKFKKRMESKPKTPEAEEQKNDDFLGSLIQDQQDSPKNNRRNLTRSVIRNVDEKSEMRDTKDSYFMS